MSCPACAVCAKAPAPSNAGPFLAGVVECEIRTVAAIEAELCPLHHAMLRQFRAIARELEALAKGH